MACRERLERLFHDSQVPFRVTPHRRAYTAQDVAITEHVSGYDVAKVVMVIANQSAVMTVLLAPYRVDIDQVRRVLNAPAARLATEKEFANLFPDCDVGAMPPFGNLYGIPVIVDRRVTLSPEITFNAGTHEETMSIAYGDFQRLVNPHVADIAMSQAQHVPVAARGKGG